MKKEYDLTRRSYEFAKQVVLFLSGSRVSWIYHPLVSQLIRSATSIAANIIEGRAGNSRRVMINHYSIALRSSNETKYWLCLLRDTTNCNKAEVKRLLDEAIELSKVLAKAIIVLKNKEGRSF
jgi:four helix bundle protein